MRFQSVYAFGPKSESERIEQLAAMQEQQFQVKHLNSSNEDSKSQGLSMVKEEGVGSGKEGQQYREISGIGNDEESK